MTAMIGTIFSVTEAMRLTPPKKMKPPATTMIRPMTQVGMPNAVLQVDAIELDCTMQPMMPSASTMATAKNPARNLPNLPLNAVLM